MGNPEVTVVNSPYHYLIIHEVRLSPTINPGQAPSVFHNRTSDFLCQNASFARLRIALILRRALDANSAVSE